MENNKDVFLPVFLGVLSGVFVSTLLLGQSKASVEVELPKPMVVVCVTNTPTPSPTSIPKLKKIQDARIRASWTGKVSHYSRSGCLGCSENLTMANGQTLDDSKPTIAFNKLPLNTQVKITNLDNGKSIVATVTDTGGFERHGRIADLVPAVANYLETKTDVSQVLIEKL